MSITDELRAWAKEHLSRSSILAIADRIDAEHQKAIRELNNLADTSVLLPVDADGVPIHVGDVMRSKRSGFFEVRSMRCDEYGWEVYDRLGDRYTPSLLRSYHAPTVEDVLREFGKAWVEWEDGSPHDPIAKYAKMFRLTGDDE